MKLISDKVTFAAIRIKYSAVPSFIRCGKYYEQIPCTINDENHNFLINPGKDFSYRQGTVYLKYSNDWWIIQKYIDNTDNKFVVAELKPKQIRKPRRRTTIPFKYNLGVDIQSLPENNTCTVRALSIAFNISFQQAYDILETAGRKAGKGFFLFIFLGSIFNLNNKTAKLIYTVNMSNTEEKYTLRSFLSKYNEGRYIVTTRNHALAVIDGVIQDTFVKPKAKVRRVWRIEKDEC